MSTVTAAQGTNENADVQTKPSRFAEARVTLPRVTRAEWIKLVSLRSTWWAAALVFAGSLGVTVLASFAFSGIEGATEANDLLVTAVTAASMLTVLLATVLGTIAVTGEYSTGMIRSTLTAAPDRTRSFVGKAVVLFAFVFVLSIVTSVVSALVAAPIFADAGLQLSWADPSSIVVPLVNNAVYLAALALFGMGVGYLVRNGAGGIAVVIGVVFVLPVIVSILATIPNMEWLHDLGELLPSNAGAEFVYPSEDGARLRAGLAIGGWTLAALGAGYVSLKSRDA